MREQSFKGEGITFAGRNFNSFSSAGKLIGVEATIWIAAIIFLALIEPAEFTHVTLCPFSAIGIDFCPGCGLGRSVSYILHGDFITSLKIHPLGIFAILVLSTRVISLIKTNWSNYGKRFSINARA